ncbi:hypothetical protein JCM9957A_09540 [Kineosporia succinea]
MSRVPCPGSLVPGPEAPGGPDTPGEGNFTYRGAECLGVSAEIALRTWGGGNRKASRAPKNPDVTSPDEQLRAMAAAQFHEARELGNVELAKPRSTCGKLAQDTVRTRRGPHKCPPPFIRIDVRP